MKKNKIELNKIIKNITHKNNKKKFNIKNN